MATAAENQGLEKAAPKTPDVILTPDEYRSALTRWQERQFNILTSFANISGIAANHGLQYVFIKINTDKAVGECYDGLPFLKKDEYALSKAGLFKLAEALGISWHSERTDPRTIQFFWEIRVTATYRSLDGTVIAREATKEWDLRDGAPQIKGWTANQIEEGRKHGLRNCEARAINAAIRSCGCGIKQRYTKAELAKHFAVVKVAYIPPDDPVIQRLVAERALAGTAQLYAHPISTTPTVEVEAIPVTEPRNVGSGSTTERRDSPDQEDQEEPPVAHAVRIAAVKEVSGTTKDSGKKWTKWIIVDSNGVEHSTFSKSFRDDAQKYKDAATWVEIDEEQSEDGRYTNITNIGPPQPSLLPDDDGM